MTDGYYHVVFLFAAIGVCWTLKGWWIIAKAVWPEIDWGWLAGSAITIVFFFIPWLLGLWKAYEIVRWFI